MSDDYGATPAQIEEEHYDLDDRKKESLETGDQNVGAKGMQGDKKLSLFKVSSEKSLDLDSPDLQGADEEFKVGD